MKLSERISWLKTTIQENLFPHLRECFDDPLTEKQRDLIMTLEVVEIEKHVTHLNDSGTGSERLWISPSPISLSRLRQD
ncbi:MAG: hypothetical protein NTX36_01810 [Proteobacteria bacterium]|nr:hypothetical protein [Pseudomonadota bacterium]